MRESYYEIGRQLGISPEEAQEAVSRAWLAHPLPTREQEVAKMLAGLDLIEKRLREVIEHDGPEVKKAQAALRKVEVRRRRLTGT